MTALAGMSLGFIGLGLMGKPMARGLMAAGAAVIGHNRSRAVVEELARDGMRRAACAREVAEKSDIVILMLVDTEAVETVLMGEDGVIAGLGGGGLVIDMGTTQVTSTYEFAAAVKVAGGDYMDAPVSGGQVAAEAGNLTIMAGGDGDAWVRAKPLFDVLGFNITHVGAVGAGQVTKTANQMFVGLTIGAVSEALVMARQAGVDPARVRHKP
jgi:3-hydroxyisobutyrate dehydrogenase-like beta-hydroxyacid dehydrogenase